MYDGKKYFELRSWMYTHRDYAGRVTNAFLNGLETFMYQAGCASITQISLKDVMFLSEVKLYKSI